MVSRSILKMCNMETGYIPGIMVSGYGGFYQVRLGDGRVIVCRARGRLKREFGGIFAGDMVEITIVSGNDGVIERILPRHNYLLRPKIANVDQAVLVMAAHDPDYDLFLLDKMILISLQKGIKPLICFNKSDLANDGELSLLVEVYARAEIDCLLISAKQNKGIDELAAKLSQGVSVLAGQSGVGKSSLLNRLLPGYEAQIGEISTKLQRGKHTTRYVTILPLANGLGMIADTPGFSLLDMPEEIDDRKLPDLYADFKALGVCRFDGCLHDKEPDCLVKQAVSEGIINRDRYQRYLQILNELRTREVKYR